MATEVDGALLVPMVPAAAAAIAELGSARLDAAANRCVQLLQHEDTVPPARLVLHHGTEGERLRLEALWDPDSGDAFERLPGVEAAGARCRWTPGWSAPSTASWPCTASRSRPTRPRPSTTCAPSTPRPPHEIRRSRATEGEPLPEVAAKLGGTLQPFQWAGVRYALDARRCFLADEQGLGKTVEALAALEADDAFPAVVVCPASLKRDWEREAAQVAAPPRRSPSSRGARRRRRPTRSRSSTTRSSPPTARRSAASGLRALVVDEAHLVKNPQAKRTQAVRRLAGAVADDGLRLALTGTPVLNHAEELIAQLRVIGRLEDFGSGARFARQFAGPADRGAPALAPAAALLRAAAEVRGAAPAAGQAPGRRAGRARQRARVPPGRARRDRVAARAAAGPLRARRRRSPRRCAPSAWRSSTTLQRLAARGKLHAALAWIHDFLASGEPLVVFARHVEVAGGGARALPRRAAPARRATRSTRATRRCARSRTRTGRSCSSAPRASPARGSRSRARRTSRSSSSSGRPRCTTRPRTGCTASASTTR